MIKVPVPEERRIGVLEEEFTLYVNVRSDTLDEIPTLPEFISLDKTLDIHSVRDVIAEVI